MEHVTIEGLLYVWLLFARAVTRCRDATIYLGDAHAT